MSTIKVTNITPQSGNTVFLTGSLTISDTLIAREVRTELTQSAVLFQSGSTKFGDDTTDIHQFTGSIVTSGSFRNNGPVTLEGIPWPAIGSEVHLLETEPFTVNLPSGNRTYDYLGIGLEHFETGSIYHNSLLIYAYDQHHGGAGPNFGTEFNVGPVRNHMRVYPSGSTSGLDIVNMANISVEDLQNGTTQALMYGNEVHLGVYKGDHIRLGNLNSSVTQSYNDNLLTGSNLLIDTTSTVISGSIETSGSILANGPVTLKGIPWPSIGSEVHLLETEPFTVNLPSGNRTYDYLGIGLEHFETGSTYHNSLLIYAYDQHHGGAGPNFGTEFNVGPIRNHMRVYPSGSTDGLDTGSMANISVEDLQNGTTQALLYGNEIQIGVYNGDHLRIGNFGTSVTQSYSEGLYNGTSLRIHNTTTAISGTLDLQGVGNISSSINSLYGSSSALDARITTNEFNVNNHYAEVNAYTASTDIRLNNLESFSSSLDSVYATDAQVGIATASLSSSLASDIAALTQATASFATTGSNTYTSNQILSSSVLLTLEPINTTPISASTGSLIVSGSPAQLYIYNGSGSTGWNRV